MSQGFGIRREALACLPAACQFPPVFGSAAGGLNCKDIREKTEGKGNVDFMGQNHPHDQDDCYDDGEERVQ